jgi:uncharacterized phiE125 gp8 family phage protein
MLKRLTTPTDMAITLEEARLFLRVEYTDDDELITSMVKGATVVAQAFINQQITECQYALALSSFQSEVSLLSPVKTIDSVKYYDTTNTLQTIDGSNYYLMDFGLPNKLIFNDGFSIDTYNRPDAIQITFTSGMTTVPSDIIQWVRIRIASMYQFREQFVVDQRQVSQIDDKYLNSFLYNHKVF